MIILKALYFFLPAYFANMAPVFATKYLGGFWSKPIWEKGLGTNKTWRGLWSAIVIGAIIAYFQLYLYNVSETFRALSLIDYSKINMVTWGGMMAFGAMFGDSVKSYFKRRKKMPPGSQWIPFDQLDFVVGGLVFILPIYQPSWQVWLVLLIVSPLLHILTNRLGFYLGIKKVKW